MDRRGDEQADGRPGLASRALTRICSGGIVLFARLLTAAQANWIGVDPVSDRPRIYFGNHVSHGDFILIWSVLSPAQRRATRPVAGADYWHANRVRRFIGERLFNALLIDRDPRARGPDPIGAMTDALDAGASLILFPEGTRNPGHVDLLPFKTGLHRLALARPEAALVPVWIDNLNRVLPKGALIPVPLMCRVSFGAPIHPREGEARAEFLERAHAALLELQPRTEAA